MSRDLAARQPTEVEPIPADLTRRGAELGRKTPLLDLEHCGALAFIIERGYTVVLWEIYVRDSRERAGWADRALARLGERDWNVLVAHDLATGAVNDLPRLLDTILGAGIEIVQEIPDHATPVRRGHPAQWVAEVSQVTADAHGAGDGRDGRASTVLAASQPMSAPIAATRCRSRHRPARRWILVGCGSLSGCGPARHIRVSAASTPGPWSSA
jgi:hypothetical protein